MSSYSWGEKKKNIQMYGGRKFRLAWPSSPVPPCCCRVWCVAGLLLAAYFVLLSEEAGISAVCEKKTVRRGKAKGNQTG